MIRVQRDVNVVTGGYPVDVFGNGNGPQHHVLYG